MNKKIRVLFVCTRNSCRSQIAEGWAKELLPDLIAESAGIERSIVDPFAVKVMEEVGVDISKQKSKLISDLNLETFDCVIVLCDDAEKNCPTIPSPIQHLFYAINDPRTFQRKDNEDILLPYRRIREEIRKLILQLRQKLA